MDELEGVWELQARSVMSETATSLALEALDATKSRLRDLNEDATNIRPAFAALAEGTWWVAAIDERIIKGLGGRRSAGAQAYQVERGRSVDGEHVAGVLWARDRHTHQLMVTMGRDTDGLFSKGRLLHISPGFMWVPSSDIYEPDESRSPASWRASYDRLLAGRSAWKTLGRCSRWFHRMAGHDAI